MSVEEVAQLLNTSVDEFTPETFKQVYKDTWIKTHEKEAAENNPNPGPELAIIEQVKNGQILPMKLPLQLNLMALLQRMMVAPTMPTILSSKKTLEVEGSSCLLLQGFLSAALRVFGI